MLGFWPFGFLVSLPLGAVVIVALVIGFLGGLAAHLPKRFGANRRAKKAEKRVTELESRLAVQSTASLPTPGVQPTIRK